MLGVDIKYTYALFANFCTMNRAGSTWVGYSHQRPHRRPGCIAPHHGPEFRVRRGAQRHHQPLKRGPDLLLHCLDRLHSPQTVAPPAVTAAPLDSRLARGPRQRRRAGLPPRQFRHVFFPRRAAPVRPRDELGRAHFRRGDHRRDRQLLHLGATSLYRPGRVGQTRLVGISYRKVLSPPKNIGGGCPPPPHAPFLIPLHPLYESFSSQHMLEYFLASLKGSKKPNHHNILPKPFEAL